MRLHYSSAALAVVQLLTLSSRVLSAPVTDTQEEDERQMNILPIGQPSQLLLEYSVPSLFDQTSHPSDEDTISIPTRYQSTLLARRLLHLSIHGDLITTFPPSQNLSTRIPSSVASTPIGLPEYIATCESESSTHAADPTILSLKISTATRNAEAGSNVSLSLSWWDSYIHLTGTPPWALANLPRLSLTGYLEEIPASEVTSKGIESCFVAKHKDSVLWLPGRKWAAHEGFWTRLVVREAYWIGGFGDKNYIGWLDADEWRGVEREEWEGVRLPGEKA